MKRLTVLASSVVVALAASGLIAPAASAQQNLIDTLSGANSTESTLACVAARISATSSESVTQVVLDLRNNGGDTSQTGVWLVEDNAGAVGSNVLGYFGYSTGSIYAQGSPVAITAGTVFWIVFKQYNLNPPTGPYTRARWTSDLNSNSGPWTYETFTGDYVADGTCVTSGSTFTSFTESNAFNNNALKVRLVGTGGGGGGSNSGDDATSQIPAPVMQQVGMPSTGCADYDDAELNIGGAGSGGWGQSWARWVNDGAGGAVCTRTLVYSPTFASWIVG